MQNKIKKAIILSSIVVIVLLIAVSVILLINNNNSGKIPDNGAVTERPSQSPEPSPEPTLAPTPEPEQTEDIEINPTPDNTITDVEGNMNFTEVNETVTAKEETNLRDKPSQGEDSSVMHLLKNGETATRTGISSSGWSRVEYNDETYYAVSSFLTTDLSYKPPVEEDDGIKTEFTDVDEYVTAKEAVNLRKKPSVNDDIAPVVVQIKNGDVVKRTGINTDVGWSRVEYNGQVLYCISSYLMLAENQ